MADKNDNVKVQSGIFPDNVMKPFPTQDRDTIPADILQFEDLISGFSTVPIDTPEEALEDELNSWLKKFVDFLRVDRCSVVEYSDAPKTIHMLLNYIVPEVDSVLVLSDYQPPEGVIDELEKGSIIRAEKIPDDLPQTLRGSIIEKDKTKSTIIVPLSIGNKVIGSISFSSYREERKWPDDIVRRMKLIGEIITHAIFRIRSHKSLLEEMDRRQKLEERYTSTIETANVGFWIVDWNQNILVVNDEYCRMSGYSREELLAKKVWELDAAGDQRKIGRDLDELINNGSTHLVATHMRKDGSLFDIEVASKIYEKDDYICSLIRDITDLNKARKELEDRLNFEELVSEFSTILIVSGDIQIELTNWLKKFVEFLRVDRGVVLEYSEDKKSVRVMMQYTVPDAPVPPLKEIHIAPELEIAEFQKSMIIKAEKIPDDLPQTFRGGIIEKDGTKSIIIVPLAIGNKVIGSMSFSSFKKDRRWTDDVDRRIKLVGEIIANAILRIRSHKALLEEMDRRQKLEEKYTSIVKTANVGFMISDLNGRIIDVNDTYSEMSGYSRDELLGMTIYQLDASLNIDKVENDLQGIYKTGSFHHETSHIKKDGTVINVLISANLLEKEGIVFSFIRDVTEMNRVQKEHMERLKFEELFSEFSAALINIELDDLNEELKKWAIKFVDFLELGRCVINEYLFEKNNIKLLVSYTDPASAAYTSPHDMDLNAPDVVMDEFRKGTIIRAEKIPEDLQAPFHGWIIEKHNTKSLVVVPLIAGHQVIGNLTLASYRKERKWPDYIFERIKLIGVIIANAILRKRSSDTLLEEMEHRQLLEEKYTSIIKSANVGFWISDLDSRILEVNDAYCMMSGYSRDELLGMTIDQIDLSLNPEYKSTETDKILEKGDLHIETSHTKKDGTIIEVAINSSFLEKEEVFFTFIRDITELNKARRDLEDRLNFEELISHFSAALVNVKPDDISKELNHWLKKFVEFLNVDRGMFHEYDYGNQIVNTLLSYTEPDIDVIAPPLVENHRPPDEIMKEFAKGIVIRADKIPEDLPPLFRGGLIEYHNTKSVVIVPLTSGDQVIGNLTFADYRKEHEWHNELIRRIKLMGEIIANAILRIRSHNALLAETKRRQDLEERYTSIIKNASVGFVLSDHDQNILDVNDEYCRMSGYSHDELIKMRIADIDFSEDPEKKVDNDIALTVESENGLYHHQTRHIHKSGRIFDVEVNSQYSESEGFFFSFVRDVTELNKARRELEERLEFEEFVSEFSAALINVKLDDISKEINHWLERFAKLLNVDRCIISEYQDGFANMNFIFSYTNPEVEDKIRPLSSEPVETYGYHVYLQRDEIIKYESPHDTFPEDIRQGLLESAKDGTKSLLVIPLKAGDILLGVMSVSTVISEMKWTQEIIRRLKLVAEIFANALMRDKTDFELDNYRKHLEELVDERTTRLREAQQELVLSEKMATLGRLTATVSHELRNPLGTIRSSLFSVNRRLKGQDERTEKALERAERSVQRCDIIIEELLDYSRAQPLNLRRTDIDNWLTELFEEEKPPEGVILERELNAGVSIDVDRERFRRCMINILTNAYQSIEEKSDHSNPGCVRVVTKRDANGMQIDISDNGVGFDQKEIGKIFEPLYSTKTFGVGLGIPITKQIVEMHGWNIHMKGEPGKGALVTIGIPIS